VWCNPSAVECLQSVVIYAPDYAYPQLYSWCNLTHAYVLQPWWAKLHLNISGKDESKKMKWNKLVRIWNCSVFKKWVTIAYVYIYIIGICCFSAQHAALRSKSKDWLARNQNKCVRVKRHVYPRTIVSVTEVKYYKCN